MALALVQKKSNSGDGSTTSVAVTVTSTAAGSLIAVFCGWEGAVGATVTVSDGTTGFTAGTPKDSGASTTPNDDNHGQWFYLLVSASGKTTITATWSAASSPR